MSHQATDQFRIKLSAAWLGYPVLLTGRCMSSMGCLYCAPDSYSYDCLAYRLPLLSRKHTY